MVGTKKRDGSSQKFMLAGALSLLQSFKGGANGLPKSVVTLWDVGSAFYLKWAVMQWTHHLHWEPQNVKCASVLEGCCICIVCCRGHENYIHTLRSKSECEHMLCWLHEAISRQRHEHLSWGMILEHSTPHTVYNNHKELLQSGNLRKIQHMVLTLHSGLLFLSQWHNTCKVTNSTARIIQEPNFCHDDCNTIRNLCLRCRESFGVEDWMKRPNVCPWSYVGSV